jgi:hypothetical protein
MRVRHFRAVAVAIGFGALPAAASAQGCVGLQCVPAGAPGAVPEAHGSHVRAPGPRGLWAKPAGFYEYDDPAGSGRIVAFVVRPGEQEAMPDSVAALKVVRDLRAAGQLDSSTVIILGPEMASITPAVAAADPARRGGEGAPLPPRPKLRAFVADYNQCAAGYFCLWATAGYYGWVSWFGQVDWMDLSSTGMGANNVEARRNWRSTDSLLADGNGGTGYRECYDSYTASAGLGAFNNRANSVFVSSADSRC